MKHPLLIALSYPFLCLSAVAVTFHLDMTPQLAGKEAVIMNSLSPTPTRFTIRFSTGDDPKPDPRRPFVRGGSLVVGGHSGRLVRCAVEPQKRGHDLLYTLELNDEHARITTFTLVEHFDDGQVGGGRVLSYRLIDFIDPEHRAKELKRHITHHDLSTIKTPSAIAPPATKTERREQKSK